MSFFVLSPIVQVTLIICVLLVLLVAAFNRNAARNLIRFLCDLLNLRQRRSFYRSHQNRRRISQALSSDKRITIKRIYLSRVIDEASLRAMIIEKEDEDEIMEIDRNGK